MKSYLIILCILTEIEIRIHSTSQMKWPIRLIIFLGLIGDALHMLLTVIRCARRAIIVFVKQK